MFVLLVSRVLMNDMSTCCLLHAFMIDVCTILLIACVFINDECPFCSLQMFMNGGFT